MILILLYSWCYLSKSLQIHKKEFKDHLIINTNHFTKLFLSIRLQSPYDFRSLFYSSEVFLKTKR